MIKDINYYRSVHNATDCQTRKDMEINAIRKRLARNFENPLDVIEFTDFFTNEIIELEIKHEMKSEVNGYLREFTSLITSPVYHGDTFYDKENNTYWICTEVVCKSKLYYEGKLTRCNSFLKWQNKKGKVFEYPVFDINSTQYNSGIASDRIITFTSSQHLLTIAADENTIALEHEKRFFNDRNVEHPSVFKLTQNDTTSLNYDKGLLKITVIEDEYNPETDNIEEWLCDYISPTDISTLPSPISITYFGKPEIRIGGRKTFKADIPVRYSIIVADIWNSKIKLIQTDDFSCVINCTNDSDMVGISFKIIAADSSNNESQVLVKVIGGV